MTRNRIEKNILCDQRHQNTHQISVAHPTSERLHLLIFGLLHFVCDLGDDEVLCSQLPDGVNQGIEATGVLCQRIQQHSRPLGLCRPAADFFRIVLREDPARAQEVEMALGPDLFAEVVTHPGQHLEIHRKRRSNELPSLRAKRVTRAGS